MSVSMTVTSPMTGPVPLATTAPGPGVASIMMLVVLAVSVAVPVVAAVDAVPRVHVRTDKDQAREKMPSFPYGDLFFGVGTVTRELVKVDDSTGARIHHRAPLVSSCDT